MKSKSSGRNTPEGPRAFSTPTCRHNDRPRERRGQAAGPPMGGGTPACGRVGGSPLASPHRAVGSTPPGAWLRLRAWVVWARGRDPQRRGLRRCKAAAVPDAKGPGQAGSAQNLPSGRQRALHRPSEPPPPAFPRAGSTLGPCALSELWDPAPPRTPALSPAWGGHSNATRNRGGSPRQTGRGGASIPTTS